MNLLSFMQHELHTLEEANNLRTLPHLTHEGRHVLAEGRRMLNLSSNDYLGLANDLPLRRAFLEGLTVEDTRLTSSSSRLLTGNFTAYEELETLLANLFGTERALVFNCGYHANTGILPAICDAQTLILADKWVHASLIDGIRLSTARCVRYRHNEYAQLERLLQKHHSSYNRIIIVTESIFSMDGDEADLPALVRLKRQYPRVLLYVDEAHAVGVRGPHGLGCAEEQGCIPDIDFLVGTFGKALASVGAYLVCQQVVRDYLVNKMRPFIFTTALPPLLVQWTTFVLRHLDGYQARRQHLALLSGSLRAGLRERGYSPPSVSHILPMIVGSSAGAVRKAEELQQGGFYALPVRPPTVPEGTARIRFSLTTDMTEEEIKHLIEQLS